MTIYGELAGKGAKSLSKSLGQLIITILALGVSLVGALIFIVYLMLSR